MNSPATLNPSEPRFVTDACTCGWLKCCITSTETVGLLGTGAQDGPLDFHTAPDLLSMVLKLYID